MVDCLLPAFLLGVLKLVFPAGSAAAPSAVAPLELTGPAVSFWWDKTAFHVGEKAYAWKSLGVRPTDGATFRIDLGETAFREKIVLEGTLDCSASRYRVSSFGPIGGSDVRGEIEIASAKTGCVQYGFSASGVTQDFLNLSSSKEVKAGDKAVFKIVGRGSSSGVGSCRVKDADGKLLYFVNGWYRDPRLMFDLKTVWTDRERRMLHVKTAGWTDSDEHVMRVRACDYWTDKPIGWTKSVKVGRIWGEREYEVDVGGLPEGFWWLHFDFVDAAGAVVYTEKAPYLRAGEKMPWDGNRLGMEDTVPPPWTVPEFLPDGTFRCWEREIKLGGKGLISSVRHGGKELLTAPVALIADGRALTFDVVPAKAKKSVAGYRLKAREADIEVKVTCEFDGFMMFEASYPTTVKSLQWRVAARRAFVIGFDDCTSEMNPNVVFSKGPNPSVFFDPSSVHMWWMPGRKGLMGGILNLHGWHAKDLAKAGRVDSTADEISVTTTFVDCPMAKGPRRTVKFYLEPTPVKPKDLKLASVDETKRVTWTGHVCDFFEVKYPGFEKKDLVEKFAKDIRDGKRVFWYNGSSGVSPEDPFWNWYGTEWNMKGLDYFAHEAPKTGRPSWRRGAWTYGCLNSRSFRDYKVWGVNWYLNEMCKEVKDLYFDLANPHACNNERHGCAWKDDFGRTMQDQTILSTRDLHKRVYRLVKAKNPDGAMFGHVSSRMCPSGVFFDMICACEGFTYSVFTNNFTYFDLYTPQVMESFFLPRAQEMVFVTLPQLLRARECCAPHLYGTYDCNAPENVRAIRHLLAYTKIYDLITNRMPGCAEGWQFYVVDAEIRKLRENGVYSAFYLEDEPQVTLSKPGPRQLWAWFAKGKVGVLIVLNDTDAAVEQAVTVKDLSANGTELLDKSAYDFTSGTCTLKLGPREAKFIKFSRGDVK